MVTNDAQSQTALLITQEPRRRGSGDSLLTSPCRVRTWASADSSALQQPPRQLHQSRLMLEKRLESSVTSFPPLDPNFAEDYVFQVNGGSLNRSIHVSTSPFGHSVFHLTLDNYRPHPAGSLFHFGPYGSDVASAETDVLTKDTGRLGKICPDPVF